MILLMGGNAKPALLLGAGVNQRAWLHHTITTISFVKTMHCQYGNR